MAVEVACELVSRSHLLRAEAVAALNRPSTWLRVTVVDAHHLRLVSAVPADRLEDEQHAMHAGYELLCRWVVAINVATLGHFDFAAKDASAAVFKVYRTDYYTEEVLRIRSDLSYPGPLAPLDDAAGERALSCMIALSREKEPFIVEEYIRGLYHFGAQFYGVDFWKDSFAGFYRCFERLIASRVLRVKRLRKELPSILRAMEQIGMPEPIRRMFEKELYPLRCEQVMHAQKAQAAIGVDPVAKMKLLCDAILNKCYEPEWRKALDDARQALTTEAQPTESRDVADRSA